MSDDSPWQDLKDAKDGFNEGLTKANDFAKHSTGRVLGPAATRLLNVFKAGCLKLLERYTKREPGPDDDIEV